MKTIWVYEDTGNGLTRLDFLLLCTSVIQYSKHHPTVTTALYIDESIHNILDDRSALSLWDLVYVVPFVGKDINKEVFWACSKLEVIATQTEPFLLLDHDFIVYENIQHTLDGYDCVFTNAEDGKGYYPLTSDENVRKLSYKRRWKPRSLNVSHLYFKDTVLSNEYANLSLDMMREFTKMNVPNSQYLIFAEQLLLYHLLKEKGTKSRPLIKESWNCNDWWWGESYEGENNIEEGVYSIDVSERSFIHYGPQKGRIKADIDLLSYDSLIESLENVVKRLNINVDGFTSK